MKFFKTFRRTAAPPLCLVFLLLFLGTACKDSGDSSSRSYLTGKPPQSSSGAASVPAGGTSSPQPETAVQTKELPPLVDETVQLTSVASLGGAYAANENGCYLLATFNDGSADIHYIDYTTRQMVLLEQPEKERDFLFGHVGDTWGGAAPVWAGENLFLFHLGGSAELQDTYGDAGRASVLRLDADGGNPAPALMPEGYSFLLASRVLMGEGMLYFLMTDSDTGATVLMSLSMDSMETSELHRLAEGYDYTIEGAWEKGPLLVAATALPPATDPNFNTAWENQQFSLLAMGLTTGMQQQLAAWSQNVPTALADDSFFQWNEDEGALYRLDLSSGENTLFASGFAPKEPEFTSMRMAPGGMVRIQFTSGRGKVNTAFYIHPQTGEVSQPPVDKLGQSISICAEMENSFLVRYENKWVRREKIDPSFDPKTSDGKYSTDYVEMPEYALISKADYWAGKSNLVKIFDLVYK